MTQEEDEGGGEDDQITINQDRTESQVSKAIIIQHPTHVITK